MRFLADESCGEDEVAGDRGLAASGRLEANRGRDPERPGRRERHAFLVAAYGWAGGMLSLHCASVRVASSASPAGRLRLTACSRVALHRDQSLS